MAVSTILLKKKKLFPQMSCIRIKANKTAGNKETELSAKRLIHKLDAQAAMSEVSLLREAVKKNWTNKDKDQ